MEALKQVLRVTLTGVILTLVASYACGLPAAKPGGDVVSCFMTLLISIVCIMGFVGWRLHREM